MLPQLKQPGEFSELCRNAKSGQLMSIKTTKSAVYLALCASPASPLAAQPERYPASAPRKTHLAYVPSSFLLLVVYNALVTSSDELATRSNALVAIVVTIALATSSI